MVEKFADKDAKNGNFNNQMEFRKKSNIKSDKIMRIIAFIQARMASTRLPGKVLKNVLGKPLLEFIIERLTQSTEINEIVVVTGRSDQDDPIVSFCQQNEIAYFRGSDEDVLDRYYQAALHKNVDAIVRVTADCPLIDPEIVDQVVLTFKKDYPQIDYVSNTLERTFPRGLDVEIFSFNALKQAMQNALKPDEREHVTLYLYRHPEKFQLRNVAYQSFLGNYRWTVDTPEDFELIRLILQNLYPVHPQFRLNHILQLIDQYPHWVKINAHVEQKKVVS